MRIHFQSQYMKSTEFGSRFRLWTHEESASVPQSVVSGPSFLAKTLLAQKTFLSVTCWLISAKPDLLIVENALGWCTFFSHRIYTVCDRFSKGFGENGGRPSLVDHLRPQFFHAAITANNEQRGSSFFESAGKGNEWQKRN